MRPLGWQTHTHSHTLTHTHSHSHTLFAAAFVAVFDLPESLRRATQDSALLDCSAYASRRARAHILYGGSASRNSLLRTWSNQLERIIFAALLWLLLAASSHFPLPSRPPSHFLTGIRIWICIRVWVCVGPDWPACKRLKAAIYLRIYSYSHLQMNEKGLSMWRNYRPFSALSGWEARGEAHFKGKSVANRCYTQANDVCSTQTRDYWQGLVSLSWDF